MTDQQHNTTADRVEQLFRTGRPQEAIDLCRRICQAPEANTEDWLLYGCVSADTGDNATAIMALGKAAELDPDFVEAQFGLGKLLAAAGDNAAAIDRLQKAAQLQPDNADIWLVLGITYGLAGEATKAEECCRRSLELQPGSAYARFNLANALQAQGKLPEAEVEYEAALQLEPGSVSGWSMLAQTRVGLRKFAEAEAAATRALGLNPHLGEAHFTLGRVLEARGEMQRARDHFTQAAELLPTLAEAHLRLGQILQHLGDYAGAVPCYQRAIDKNPDLVRAHCLLGECLQELKRPVEAEKSYRRALTLNNDYVQAHDRFAYLLITLNRNAEAAEHFAEVLRINPNNEQARHMLAAQQGDTTPTAPAHYVAGLFDTYADTFDSTLVGQLNYRTPEHLYELVSQQLAPATNSLDIIDLGCGTGLCAPLFRGMARTLHGIDLAPRMIEKARERKLYDALDVGDIVVALKSRTAAWDLAISADVFVYIGDLQEVFTACSSALRPGGLLAFSVEASDDSDTYVLRPSGRYAHALSYIRSLGAAAGLHEVAHRAVFLRHEKGKKMPGYIFLLRRPIDVLHSAYHQKIEYIF